MGRWKKGALHTHTFWSDGESLPEVVAYTYREVLHYDFLCITDHNIFPDEENFYYPVTADAAPTWPPALSFSEVERAKQLPGCEIEEKILGVRRMVKLKTFDELRRKWEIPDKFILIGGSEISACSFTDREHEYDEIHLNAVNCRRTILPARGRDRSETFRMNVELYKKAACEEKSNSFLMVNHPFWRYWDLDPELLLENPDLRFLEICNNCSDKAAAADEPVNSPEKFWDFVLAHRLADGGDVVYGTATDDAHRYAPKTIRGHNGCDHGWVMVNCPGEMNADTLVSAMKAGDFYASCGVSFAEIDFDRGLRRLTLKIAPESGVDYTIRFIVTRRDFNRRTDKKFIAHADPRFCRTVPVIGNDIGFCARSVNGIEASYTMEPDDLYVRAEAVSDRPTELRDMFYPETMRAWTQPFV